MADLFNWAAKWRIPTEALHDLQQQMKAGVTGQATDASQGRSESNVQSRIRLEAAGKGLHLWRNNVGACVDENGNHIRYGLANDSKKMNKVIKSSDLIGLRPVLIMPHHVGRTFGQFVAREVKAEGWGYSGTEREQAQLRFIELVIANGGDASFCSAEGSL